MARVEIEKKCNYYRAKITRRARTALRVIFLSKYKMHIYSFAEKGRKVNYKYV